MVHRLDDTGCTIDSILKHKKQLTLTLRNSLFCNYYTGGSEDDDSKGSKPADRSKRPYFAVL